MSLLLSWDILAESERTRPPTMARQLETEAIRPMRKLVVAVVCSPMPKLRRPDFWRRKKRARAANPIGRACQIVDVLVVSGFSVRIL